MGLDVACRGGRGSITTRLGKGQCKQEREVNRGPKIKRQEWLVVRVGLFAASENALGKAVSERQILQCNGRLKNGIFQAKLLALTASLAFRVGGFQGLTGPPNSTDLWG